MRITLVSVGKETAKQNGCKLSYEIEDKWKATVEFCEGTTKTHVGKMSEILISLAVHLHCLDELCDRIDAYQIKQLGELIKKIEGHKPASSPQGENPSEWSGSI